MVFMLTHKEALNPEISVSRILLYFYKNIQNEKSADRYRFFLFAA